MSQFLNCKDLRTLLALRQPPVRLLAVSKGQSAEKIRTLYHEGQREFGENYLDELEAKADSLRDLDEIRWVFIGQLQSNKIQRIVRVASEIQTLATEKHIRYIARYVALNAQESNRTPFPVFIEINCDEEQKGGASQAEAAALGNLIQREFPVLDLRGIMTIPPAVFSDEACGAAIPPLYLELATLAKTIGRGELSLGMSGDRQLALAAGSSCLRIGRSLFGE